jgi:hypothetical protein
MPQVLLNQGQMKGGAPIWGYGVMILPTALPMA